MLTEDASLEAVCTLIAARIGNANLWRELAAAAPLALWIWDNDFYEYDDAVRLTVCGNPFDDESARCRILEEVETAGT